MRISGDLICIREEEVNNSDSGLYAETDHDLDDRRPENTRRDYPVTQHPNTVPPTEFMALGFFSHQ